MTTKLKIVPLGGLGEIGASIAEMLKTLIFASATFCGQTIMVPASSVLSGDSINAARSEKTVKSYKLKKLIFALKKAFFSFF